VATLQPGNQKITNLSQTKYGFEDFLLRSGKLDTTKTGKLSILSNGSGASLTDTLLKEKILDEEELAVLRAEYYKLPFIDMNKHVVDKEVLAMVPQKSIAMYQFVPFAFDGRTLKVAITDPTNLTSLEALEFFAQKKRYIVEIYLTSLSGFRHAVSENKNISLEVKGVLQDIEDKQRQVAEKNVKKDGVAATDEKVIIDAPITKIVDVIVKHAIEARASDIHIEPSEHDMRVRYRIDGVLQNSLVVPKSVHAAIISRIKILSNLKIDETRLPQDGRFHIQFGKTSVDFRVSTLPTVNGEKAVLRILDKSTGVPTLDELGVWGKKLAMIEDNLKKSHGMVLVTGPTGSGKSTTLSSVLTRLNKVGVNIVTLEDPVEYYIDGVNQAQVRAEIGLTFASGLRSILRQDPNIVMVGEIRDAETAELAVHAALTGHLVFSTLHTNDAIGAIPRLIDMGVDNFLLVASLNLVMAQRLVRKLCEECKKRTSVSKDLSVQIRKELEGVDPAEIEDLDFTDMKIHEAVGCNACGSSGYKGRVGIFEVLNIEKKIKQLMSDKSPMSQILDEAIKQGMVSMKQDGYIKVLRSITTVEEVLRVTKI